MKINQYRLTPIRLIRYFLCVKKVAKDTYKGEEISMSLPPYISPFVETTKGKSLGSPLLDYLSLGCMVSRSGAYFVSADYPKK